MLIIIVLIYQKNTTVEARTQLTANIIIMQTFIIYKLFTANFAMCEYFSIFHRLGSTLMFFKLKKIESAHSINNKTMLGFI